MKSRKLRAVIWGRGSAGAPPKSASVFVSDFEMLYVSQGTTMVGLRYLQTTNLWTNHTRFREAI